MIRRRRPLLRAAMLGTATYRAGRRGAEQVQHESGLATLTGFKELLDSGVLTQQEFDAEKERILRGWAGRDGGGAAGR